jgi:hypothetical protein
MVWSFWLIHAREVTGVLAADRFRRKFGLF